LPEAGTTSLLSGRNPTAIPNTHGPIFCAPITGPASHARLLEEDFIDELAEDHSLLLVSTTTGSQNLRAFICPDRDTAVDSFVLPSTSRIVAHPNQAEIVSACPFEMPIL
jgi:hypothetical protein